MNPDLITIHFTTGAGLSDLQKLTQQALDSGAQSLIVLAGDGNGCDPMVFDPWLQSLPVTVAGGVFTQLIHDQRHHEQGYLVLGWPEVIQVRHVAGLSDSGVDFTEQVGAALSDAMESTSLMVWVDGLSSRIAAFLDGLYDVMGADIAYFGGGAGSLSFIKKPCLFSNRGMLQDHAQLVCMRQPVSLGVDHGWQPFSGHVCGDAVPRQCGAVTGFSAGVSGVPQQGRGGQRAVLPGRQLLRYCQRLPLRHGEGRPHPGGARPHQHRRQRPDLCG